MATRPRLRPLPALLAIAMLASAGAPASASDGGAFKVIVNPENHIASVSAGFLRDVFLDRETAWADGAAVRPIDLAASFPSRNRFTEDVVKKTSAQLQSYWYQQIFSGKGAPPPEAASSAEVIDFVLTHPGAVGYLPADADPGRAKVVQVR